MSHTATTYKFNEMKPPLGVMVTGIFDNGEEMEVMDFYFNPVTRKCADEKGKYIECPRRWWPKH